MKTIIVDYSNRASNGFIPFDKKNNEHVSSFIIGESIQMTDGKVCRFGRILIRDNIIYMKDFT